MAWTKGVDFEVQSGGSDSNGGGSTTVANLAALRTFQSSRANELGLGTVQPAHVDQANNYHG